ncbi:MAG: hypothetical protein WD991_01635 [Candidatus Paceibacterota bacterium]
MLYQQNNSVTLIDLLVATLASGRSVRRFRSIISERQLERYKKGSVRVALSRLRVKQYAERSASGWALTEKGREHARNIYLLGYFVNPFGKNSVPNTIISFDIPQENRYLRDWLRNQIKIFGYKMLQQSLWMGPGPLPRNFMKRLDELKIRKNIKTFRVAKTNI